MFVFICVPSLLIICDFFFVYSAVTNLDRGEQAKYYNKVCVIKLVLQFDAVRAERLE